MIVSTVPVNLKDSPPFSGDDAQFRYRNGQSLLAAGKSDEARREFIAARDLDTLRFRADSQINRAIRETAGKPAYAWWMPSSVLTATGYPATICFTSMCI